MMFAMAAVIAMAVSQQMSLVVGLGPGKPAGRAVFCGMAHKVI